ncbi:MAG: GntP family permease, partial [Propionibacterium sp.]|nr:GntP family permease [Propionibacterium sp.]
ICVFLGTPVIALAAGMLLAIVTLATSGKLDKFTDLTEDTLKVVGPILFITGAGGVLGRVIASTEMVPYITENADVLASFGILFPFMLSALLKTAQGSSTVALVTTSGILAPMLPTLGLDTEPLMALTVMAIAAGSMTVSHANDSYFWVVTKFGGLTADQGYKTQTVMTGILGVTSMIGVFILWLILR